MPVFTQRHYIITAEVLRNRFCGDDDKINAVVAEIAIDFARFFSKDNERFKRNLFFRAASGNGMLYPLQQRWDARYPA
jgi:hypothetical protein